MGQETPGVNMSAQAASGGHAWNAHVHHLADKVFNEGGALRNHGQIRGFIQAHGHGLNFPHGNAAVGQEAFKQGNQMLHFLAMARSFVQMPPPREEETLRAEKYTRSAKPHMVFRMSAQDESLNSSSRILMK